MVKAWMNAIIDRLEQLQRQIKQLEARQDG
jgi:hypothetical protein